MNNVLVEAKYICCKLLEEIILFLLHPFPANSNRKDYNEFLGYNTENSSENSPSSFLPI